MLYNQRASIGSRIVRGTSAFVPTTVGLFSVIVTALPFGAVGGLPLAPLFPLAAVYFFVLTRPAQMTPISVFSIGILQDFLTGSPAGLWALVYLTAYGVTAALRVLFVGRSAGAAWPGFLIVAVASGVAIWVLAMMFYGTYVPVIPITGQLMLTAALYPAMAWVFAFFLSRREE